MTSDPALLAYLTFPYVRQAFRLERTREHIRRGTVTKTEHEVVYGLTSVPAERASAEQVLTWVRRHWGIENREHYVRDMTFDEDRCRVRHPQRAWILAAVRNLAMSVLRMAGAVNIRAATRSCAARPDGVLRLLGLRVPVSA
jgi:predicted transposase YbfD/YdcC